MNIETLQKNAASDVLDVAIDYASHYSGKQDIEAVVVAILWEALEIATPDLSTERRAALIMGDQE